MRPRGYVEVVDGKELQVITTDETKLSSAPRKRKRKRMTKIAMGWIY